MTPEETFDHIVEMSCRSFAGGTAGFITYFALWQEIHGYAAPFVLPLLMNDLGQVLRHAAAIGAPAITTIVVRAPGQELTEQAKVNIRNAWERYGQTIDDNLDCFIADQTNRTLAYIRPLCRNRA